MTAELAIKTFGAILGLGFFMYYFYLCFMTCM